MKFTLIKGKEAFDNCIDILMTTTCLKPLELSEIKVNLDMLDDKINYENSLKGLRESHPSKMIEINYDINNISPEIIVVLQLVDDNKNNGKRRNNILSEKFVNLGISIKKGKSRYFTILLTFSD